MNFQIRIDNNFNVDQILNKIEKGAEHGLKKTAERILETAKDKAPLDLGRLKNGIYIKKISSLEYRVISDMPHSAPMEYGTKPFFPPIAPLKAWAGRKLGNEQLGYAVALKISRDGIKPQPYMLPAFYQNERYIKEDVLSGLRREL